MLKHNRKKQETKNRLQLPQCGEMDTKNAAGLSLIGISTGPYQISAKHCALLPPCAPAIFSSEVRSSAEHQRVPLRPTGSPLLLGLVRTNPDGLIM